MITDGTIGDGMLDLVTDGTTGAIMDFMVIDGIVGVMADFMIHFGALLFMAVVFMPVGLLTRAGATIDFTIEATTTTEGFMEIADITVEEILHTAQAEEVVVI